MDSEDGEEAEPVEPISKEEAAERLLVGLALASDLRSRTWSECVCVCVTGNGEDHRRAERDLGGEAEEDGVHPPGEVGPPPSPVHASLALSPAVCLPPREAILAEMGVSIKEDGGTLGVFSPKGVSPAAGVTRTHTLSVQSRQPS